MYGSKDWEEWHTHYNDENSNLSERLAVVQDAIRQSLPQNPVEPITILDICSGDGRDIAGALNSYPNKDLIRGLLTEINPNLANKAKELLRENGIKELEVVVADAAETKLYTNYVPADLILLCGIFGNISDEDIETTISFLPSLCKNKATVIWTRHRRTPDVTPWIRNLFQHYGFIEVDFIAPECNTYAVGVNRFIGKYLPQQEHRKLFTFKR